MKCMRTLRKKGARIHARIFMTLSGKCGKACKGNLKEADEALDDAVKQLRATGDCSIVVEALRRAELHIKRARRQAK